MKNTRKVLNFECQQWPSEISANQCQSVNHVRLPRQHWLAGNSEGHRGISKFLFAMVPYNYYGALATGIREVAFFYHLKYQSYIVKLYSSMPLSVMGKPLAVIIAAKLQWEI